jgi:hypothetical protein
LRIRVGVKRHLKLKQKDLGGTTKAVVGRSARTVVATAVTTASAVRKNGELFVGGQENIVKGSGLIGSRNTVGTTVGKRVTKAAVPNTRTVDAAEIVKKDKTRSSRAFRIVVRVARPASAASRRLLRSSGSQIRGNSGSRGPIAVRIESLRNRSRGILLAGGTVKQCGRLLRILLEISIGRNRLRSRSGGSSIAIDGGRDGKVFSNVDGLKHIGVVALVNVMKMSLSLVTVAKRVLGKLL